MFHLRYRFEDSNPSVLLNPGRLRISYSSFQLLGEVRLEILELRMQSAQGNIDLQMHPALQERLNIVVEVCNVPLSMNINLPPHYLAPFRVRLRELIPMVRAIKTSPLLSKLDRLSIRECWMFNGLQKVLC